MEKSIINITSPSCSCLLHSSNCIACQRKWNRCKDMAFTDWMNFISSHARGPLYLILSMTHFFLPSFPQYLKVYVMHQQDRLLLSQLRLTFPSSMDGARSQNCSKLPHLLELDNRTPPTTSNRAQFGAYGLSQSEAFPPLSPLCSDIDGECDVTLHIKVSASIRSRHLVTRRSPRHFVTLRSEVGAGNWLLFQAVVD